MEVTEKKIIINSENQIQWSEVEEIRVMDSTLILELVNGSSLKIENVSPFSMDHIFRAFESYLKNYPRKKNEKKSQKNKIT